jgi:hypothetical protein
MRSETMPPFATLVRTLSRVLLALCLAALPGVAVWAAEQGAEQGAEGGVEEGAEVGSASFQFELLNQAYSQVDTTLPPVERGPLTLLLSSPQATLTLLHHNLRLTPEGQGVHRAELEVEIEGQGDVVAELKVAGSGSRFTDRVTVPRQAGTLVGRVRFEAHPEGYQVTVLELPETFEVRMETGIGGSLLAVCNGFGGFLPLGCDAIEKALTVAPVPLPPAGDVFFLGEPFLTPDDRVRLEAYLGPVEGEPAP